MSAQDDVERMHPEYSQIKADASLVRDMMSEDETKLKCIASRGVSNLTVGSAQARDITGYSGYDSRSTFNGLYLKLPLSYKNSDATKQNDRYEEYVEHSYLPEFIVSDALEEMTGICFKVAPDVRLPDALMHLESHANARGDSLRAVAEMLLRDVIETGGGCVYPDYINNQAIIDCRRFESLINWRKASSGYTMMVFSEAYLDDDSKVREQRRHYELVDGRLVVTLFREDSKSGSWIEYQDLDDNGNPVPQPSLVNNRPYDFIPVRVARAKRPPLLAMAKTVLKGFKISADYFGMLHTLQPTLVIKSDDSADKLTMGFKSGIKIGKDDDALLLQQTTAGAAPLKDAMEDMFNKAVDQGVRLISMSRAAETEGALYLRNANKQIRADSIARKVSSQMTEALRVCAILEGANPEEVEYSLNVELIEEPIRVEALKELREAVVDSGLVSWTDYLKKLSLAKLITLDRNSEGGYDFAAYTNGVNEEQQRFIERETQI